MPEAPIRVGVLAIQGGFAAHSRAFASLGAEPREVRDPDTLSDLDCLVLPGGESTTISKGMERDGFDLAIRDMHARGVPIMGSCAGMILADRHHLALGDYACKRNAFGRQLASFERELVVSGIGDEPLRAVFIRAPWVEDAGSGVETLAEVDGHPVAVRDGNLLSVAFHPELTDDTRIHALFMAMASGRRGAGAEAR